MSKVSDVMKTIKTLSYDEMIELNRSLVAEIKFQRKDRLRDAARSVSIGDIVKFEDTRRGRFRTVHIKIEKFNRDYTAVKGHECTPDGKKVELSPMWTVATTLVQPTK